MFARRKNVPPHYPKFCFEIHSGGGGRVVEGEIVLRIFGVEKGLGKHVEFDTR